MSCEKASWSDPVFRIFRRCEDVAERDVVIPVTGRGCFCAGILVVEESILRSVWRMFLILYEYLEVEGVRRRTVFCGEMGPLNLAGKSCCPFLTMVTPPLGFIRLFWIIPEALGKLGLVSVPPIPTSFSSSWSISMMFHMAFAFDLCSTPRILIDRSRPLCLFEAVMVGVISIVAGVSLSIYLYGWLWEPLEYSGGLK